MYLIDSLDNVDKLVFFDIDQTLSTSIMNCFIPVDEIISLQEEYDKRGIIRAKAIDSIYLCKESLALFAGLMHVKGVKAVCISSWVSTNDLKDKVIEEIKTIFSEYADFPDDWLVGISAGGSGDRVQSTVIPFIEKANYKKDFVVIDDSGDKFSLPEKVVTVDGRISFNIYDFVDACDILNIKSIEEERLNYHLQYIRKERKEA